MAAKAARETPWGVRAALLLLVGAVASAFALVITVSALSPRVAAEVVGSVDASLILPEETDLPELRERSFVYAADGSLLSILHDAEDRRVIPLEALPDHVWQAVLTAEDRRFFEHDGYDIEGFGRAALANLQARGISQGGSTITQQLAKMNFLDASQTLDRKFHELLYAIAMEEEFEKEELLERYLNQIYFGSGAYGIQAAAEEYFGISASELRADQAALLAGAIRAPSAYNPRSNPERAQAQRNRILADMVDEGYLPGQVAADLRARELNVLDQRPDEVREPYVVEAVKQQILDDPTFGETRDDRAERLFGGGLEIHTTVDPELQEIARDVVDERFPEDAPTAALASVDPESGAVRAVYSGRDFDEEQFDLALQGRRSPGSSFKTFVMLEALRQGYPPSLTLDGSNELEITFDEGRQVWEPTNYNETDFDSRSTTESKRSVTHARRNSADSE